jgi:hypothetical protein
VSQSPQRKPSGRPETLLRCLTRSGRGQKVVCHLPSTIVHPAPSAAQAKYPHLSPFCAPAYTFKALSELQESSSPSTPTRFLKSRRSLTYIVRPEVPSCYFNYQLRPCLEPSPLARSPRFTRPSSVSILSTYNLLLRPSANCQ